MGDKRAVPRSTRTEVTDAVLVSEGRGEGTALSWPRSRENEEMANDKKDDGKPETPEDVATLYGWANPETVKRRDFQTDGRERPAQQQMQRPEVTRSEVTPMVKPPAPVAKPVIRRAQSSSAQLANRYRAQEHKSPENIYAVVETPAAAPEDDFAAQQSDRPAWLNQ